MWSRTKMSKFLIKRIVKRGHERQFEVAIQRGHFTLFMVLISNITSAQLDISTKRLGQETKSQ